ncbi:MAG: hypothetical protein U0X75_24180 [Acidobacteriota bacterium]
MTCFCVSKPERISISYAMPEQVDALIACGLRSTCANGLRVIGFAVLRLIKRTGCVSMLNASKSTRPSPVRSAAAMADE